MSINFNKDEIDMVIYHYPCSDGFGSAYVVWRYYKETGNTRKIEWVGAGYGNQLPNVEGKNVLICDYSYNAKQMEKIMGLAKSVLIIDHHKTAEKELEQFPATNKIFAMDHSGTTLTWNYFYPGKETPSALLYIEDRDIWKKQLPNSDAFSAWFYTLAFDFELYHQVANNENDIMTKGIEKGLVYLEYDSYRTKEIVKHAVPKFVRFSNRDGEIYAMVSHVCSNIIKSELGHQVFYEHPYTDVGAVYTPMDKSNETAVSLRSTNYHMDSSYISKTYLGGGGHRNAAGCILPAISSEIASKVYDSTSYWVINKGLYTHKPVTVTLEDGSSADIPIVYLNTSHHRVPIGKYLMQTKFRLTGTAASGDAKQQQQRDISQATSIIALRAVLDNYKKETLKQMDTSAMSEDEQKKKAALAVKAFINWDEGSSLVTQYRAELDKTPDFMVAGVWCLDSDMESKFKFIFSKKTPLAVREAFNKQIIKGDQAVDETQYIFKMDRQGYHKYL